MRPGRCILFSRPRDLETSRPTAPRRRTIDSQTGTHTDPPAFSVVIPSHNRLDTLPEVIRALEGQEDAPEFEVVVVDDGSTDGTVAWLREVRPTVLTRVLFQENLGPATARNRGVGAARGERVAFLGDDTVPSPRWLRYHDDAARSDPTGGEIAVLGYTLWHPRMRLTPFLDYINEYGLQFGYSLIEDPRDVPFQFFYTSNVSVGRRLLIEEPFDLSFPYPAWEDIELSYRLRERGLRLIYELRAVVHHDHPTTLERFATRQARAGYCAVVFYRRHPELGGFLGVGEEGPPPLPRRGPQKALESLARLLQYTPLRLPRLWETVLRYHYISGLREGWSDGAGLEKGSRHDHNIEDLVGSRA